MDLWDLTRLLFRRWYFALPILLTSVLTAGLAGQSVKPDYRATGNMVFIPARGPSTAQATPKPGDTARPKNPWLDLGFNALGNAAILKVVDKRTLKDLHDAGLSDSITVQMNERSPLLYVEATADTPAKATATVRQVIKLLVAEIESQQRQFSVLPEDTITTLTLNDGADVETVTSKVKRVLIVIFGLGLLLTAGGTIGLDALVRRRRNRALAAEAGEEAGEEAESPRHVRIQTGSVKGGRSPVRPEFMRPRPAGEDSEATSQLPYPRVTGAADNRQEHGGSGDWRRVTEPATAGPSEAVEQIIAQYQLASTSGDETVVLPRVQRLKQEDRNAGR